MNKAVVKLKFADRYLSPALYQKAAPVCLRLKAPGGKLLEQFSASCA